MSRPGVREVRRGAVILDALLNLDGGVKPEMVATDNASYSDMGFGLFTILGYTFSPRFRDLDDQRFWRATMPGVEKGRTARWRTWPATA